MGSVRQPGGVSVVIGLYVKVRKAKRYWMSANVERNKGMIMRRQVNERMKGGKINK